MEGLDEAERTALSSHQIVWQEDFERFGEVASSMQEAMDSLTKTITITVKPNLEAVRKLLTYLGHIKVDAAGYRIVNKRGRNKLVPSVRGTSNAGDQVQSVGQNAE